MRQVFGQYTQQLYRDAPISSQAKSLTWFSDSVRRLDYARIRTMSVDKSEIISDYETEMSNISRGYLFLFGYSPLTAAKLPYYDTFPLVVPFIEKGMTFTGLNFHYLPYEYRASLMDKLITVASNKSFNEKMQLRFTYNLINDFSLFKEVKPAIKQYYKNRMVTKSLQIDVSDWNKVLFLPLENFKKKTKEEVWKRSAQIIEGN